MPIIASKPDRSRRGLSLRYRLTLWMMGVFLIIHMTLGLLFLAYQQRSISGAFENHILVRTRSLAETIAPHMPGLSDSELTQIEIAELGSLYVEQISIALYDTDGRLLASPLADPPRFNWDRLLAAVAQRPDALLRSRDYALGDPDAIPGSQRMSVYEFRGDNGRSYVLTVSAADDFVRRTIRLTAMVLLFTASLGALASGIAGWMIAGVAIAPIREATRAVEHFSATALEVATEGEHESSEDSDFEFEDTGAEMQNLKTELDEARHRLDRAFRAQERFISNISHELKTPIATLLTEAGVLETGGLPDDAARFVSSVREEMRRLGKLVESFLMLARLREGKPPEYSNRYPANELVMDSVEHCASAASQGSVSLEPSLLEDEEDLDTLVAGDHALLRTMIDNLVFNAIRFSPVGEQVDVRLEREGDELLIRVRDHGPGIPPEMLRTIFDRFTRAQEDRTQGRGYGLGLQIAQGIAELHGGDITAHNKESGGCEFVVSLPVARDD